LLSYAILFSSLLGIIDCGKFKKVKDDMSKNGNYKNRRKVERKKNVVTDGDSCDVPSPVHRGRDRVWWCRGTGTRCSACEGPTNSTAKRSTTRENVMGRVAWEKVPGACFVVGGYSQYNRVRLVQITIVM
jgi:hypothetical protein